MATTRTMATTAAVQAPLSRVGPILSDPPSRSWREARAGGVGRATRGATGAGAGGGAAGEGAAERGEDGAAGEGAAGRGEDGAAGGEDAFSAVS